MEKDVFDQRNMTILIVDDEARIRDFVRMNLEMDGFETLRHIREVSTIPVIMLTVRQTDQDKIRGLDLGADDYLGKPFNPRELLSRIRALLRRSFMAPPARKTEIMVDPDIKIDFSRREVI